MGLGKKWKRVVGKLRRAALRRRRAMSLLELMIGKAGK